MLKTLYSAAIIVAIALASGAAFAAAGRAWAQPCNFLSR